MPKNAKNPLSLSLVVGGASVAVAAVAFASMIATALATQTAADFAPADQRP